MLRAGARRWRRSGRCCATASVLTTAIYAKVDRDALRQIARPWPGRRAGRDRAGAIGSRDYLAVRRALGSGSRAPRSCWPSSSPGWTQRGEQTITTDLGARVGDAARGDRLELARPPALGRPRVRRACPRAGSRPSNCRRRTCCPSGRDARCPTSTPTARFARLMAAASVIPTPHRAATMRTLIGLLAVTGMRIGEAIRLDQRRHRPPTRRADRRREQVRQVPRAGRPRRRRPRRCAPTWPARDRPVPAEPTDAVFTSAVGTRLTYCNVHLAFKRIVAHAGLVPRSTVCRPRPHDLRHTFAVNTLLDAYRDDAGDGEHIQARIALLSHLPRARQPGIDLLVLAGRPGAARARRGPPRESPRAVAR